MDRTMRFLLAAGALLLLTGCGGIDPCDISEYLCKATCDGECVKTESCSWACKPAEDPCLDADCECGCEDGACIECPTPPDPPLPPADPHVPKCKPAEGFKCDCWTKGPSTNGEWVWAKCDVPPDVPDGDFAACEERYTSHVCLEGGAEMGAYWYQNRIADFTPKLKNKDRCAYYDFIINGSPRLSCPTTQDADPRRGPSEVELMGGPTPRLEVIVLSGDITVSQPDGWKAKVHGSGSGKLRACYPNGKACSKWLVFSY